MCLTQELSRVVGICDRSLEGTNMNLKASDVSLYHWLIGLHRSRLFHPPFVIHIFGEEASYWSESIQQIHHVGVSKNRGIPQNGWFIINGIPLSKWDVLGGKTPLFSETQMCCLLSMQTIRPAASNRVVLKFTRPLRRVHPAYHQIGWVVPWLQGGFLVSNDVGFPKNIPIHLKWS